MSTSAPPPYVSGRWPLAGHAVEFKRDLNGLMRRGYQEHGDIFAVQLANKHVAVASGAAYNKLFYAETDRSLNISDVYGFLKRAFGEVLFIAPHDVYLNQRAILQAIFSRDKMAQYAAAMQIEVQGWLDRLGEQGEIDISAEALLITQHVAGHAFIGSDHRDELGERFWQDYVAISRSLDPLLPPELPLPKFVRRDRATEAIRERLIEIIERRRRHPERYDDLIAQLLTQPQQDGTLTSDDDIIKMFMALLFAGHETTAGQAAWTIVQLLQHPTYLRLVKEEIAQYAPYGSSLDGRLLRKLKHVYWAIEETTRLRPSAPLQLRIVEKPLQIGGYTIPAGWLMQVSAETSHYLPDVFNNPYAYDPLRYAPQRREGSSHSIVTFGGGMHKCTGINFAKNEMAILTTLLLQQFEIELATADPQQLFNVGAARPGPTMIRYRRKEQAAPSPSLQSIAELH